MSSPEKWDRNKGKESGEVVYYWRNQRGMVVAVKKKINPASDDDYKVIYLDKKIYGAPIRNRRKHVGSGSNKEKLRKKIVRWMRSNPEAGRSDYESLQNSLRRSI